MGTYSLSNRLLHCAAAFPLVVVAAPALAQQRTFDLPAQPAQKSIPQFARQAGVQIVAPGQPLQGMRTAELQGTFDVRAGLNRLLQGTGLHVLSDGGSVITLGSAPNSSGRIQIASTQAVEPASQPVAKPDQPDDADSNREDEIVVTAQRRQERLSEVPVPVTVIDAEPLVQNNQLRVEDYFTRVPGLSLTMTGNENAPTVVIRGLITGGASNPTVSTVVDEVVYSPSISNGATPTVPDIDPNDLARIEVLRGPQGTLYGASSLGGLLKFVTVDPSTDEVSGRVQAGVSTIAHSDDIGYNLRGSVNVPILDTVAMRASGFYVRTPGYIDNVKTGEEDVNGTDSYGGRASLLWRPSSNFSLRLGALAQNVERENGSDQVNTTLGGLRNSFLPDSNSFSRRSRAYTATMNANLGGVELVSATGFITDDYRTRLDSTPLLGGFYANLAFAFFNVRGAVQPFTIDTHKFSQELRATIPVTDGLQWLVGAFYTDERSDAVADILAVDPNTGAEAGSLVRLDTPINYREYALFSNLTVEFTDRFDVQLGGRVSHNRQTFTLTRSGPLVPLFFGGVTAVSERKSSETPVTYLLTPRFKISPHLMAYARFASGYRPGGPNLNCGAPGVECTYGSDSTRNYEIGLKGDVLDRALTFDLSVYQIDWSDIQVTVAAPGILGFIQNAGEARSRGIELSLEARPWTGMSLSGWIAYNNAEFTKLAPNTTLGAQVGDSLPFSSPWSGTVSAQQSFPLNSTASAFVGGAISYVDDRLGGFRRGGLPREVFPNFVRVDLNAGIRLPDWDLNLYANNIFDKKGVLRGGLDLYGPGYRSFIEPRTIGLSLSRRF